MAKDVQDNLDWDEITGESLCPGCRTPNLIKKSDKNGNLNFFCTGCGWARLGSIEFPAPAPRDSGR